MIARHCLTHGDVIPVRGRCPWGCDHKFPAEPRPAVPAVDDRIAVTSLIAANVVAIYGGWS